MSDDRTKRYNMVHVLYNNSHPPFLYGVFHRVDGDLSNQWPEKSFVISRRGSLGDEIVYGTVARLPQLGTRFG